MAPSPSPRRGLLAAGNWIADTAKIIDAWPEQDTLCSILSEQTCNGGGAYNILVDLAALGAPFPLEGAGMIGRDAAGDAILADCARCGIATPGLLRHPIAPTSYTDVMTDRATGRRTFFHQRGANQHLASEHLRFTETRARWFYLGYPLLLDALDAPDPDHGTGCARVLAAARAAGLRTMADLVSVSHPDYAAHVARLLPHTDVLVLNEIEAARATGIELAGPPAVTGPWGDAAERLLRGGVAHAVVIHHPEGALAAERSGARHLQPALRVPAEAIRGTVGAGDAFAAGLLYGLHEGEPLEACLRTGVCAAAACLTDATTSGGMRPRADCLALAFAWGFRSGA
jgi:sugar/nucleoside kinase (ribokinase family)